MLSSFWLHVSYPHGLCMWMPSLLKTQIPAKGVAGWDHTVIRTPGRFLFFILFFIFFLEGAGRPKFVLSRPSSCRRRIWCRGSRRATYRQAHLQSSSLSDFPSRLSTLSETPGLSWAPGPQLVGLASSLRRKLFVGRWKGTWRWQGVYRRKGGDLC